MCWCMVIGDLSCIDMFCYLGKYKKLLYSGFMIIGVDILDYVLMIND